MRSAVLIAAVLAAGCHQMADENTDRSRHEVNRQRQLLPEAFVRKQDQELARRLNSGIAGPLPCEGIEMYPADQCYRFGKAERMAGVWNLGFESSIFCPAPASECSDDSEHELWLEFRDDRAAAKFPPGGRFAVEFVGRKNLYPGTFGRLGMFPNEVIVDRMVSMEKLKE